MLPAPRKLAVGALRVVTHHAHQVRVAVAARARTLAAVAIAPTQYDCGAALVRTFSAAAAGKNVLVGHTSDDSASTLASVGVGKPLAFVNRYAEALDVLVPNLANTQLLDDREEGKFSSPLAAQLPGTGKTVLGIHLQDILRRPRDPPSVEKSLAERLKRAWCFGEGRALNEHHLAHALASNTDKDKDENLVVRTLLTAYPAQRDLIKQLKDTTPITIRMQELVSPDFGFSFDKALGYAIFCNARGLDGGEPETRKEFVSQDPTLQPASGAVKAIRRERGGAPVVFIFDDITDLGGPEFVDYFKDVPRDTPLHRAMSGLSMRLQVLHRVRGCFIYLTGRSLWLSTQALVGAVSPLFVTPMLLQPLTTADVRETMQRTLLPDGRALQDALGVHPDALAYFADAVVQLSGGMGRPLQYLLRTQANLAASQPLLALRSEPDVDAALERCMEIVGNIPGLKQLRVEWKGPVAAVTAGELPQWAQQRAVQLQILQFLARLILLDVAFPTFTEWVGLAAANAASTPGTAASGTARVVDLAMALGIPYVSAGDGSDKVRLHASSWLCRSLARDPALLEGPRTLTTARMLDAMQTFSGTMRGRPFELMCADALCFHHMMLRAPQQQAQRPRAQKQRAQKQPFNDTRAALALTTATEQAAGALPTLGKLLPHCASTKLGASILEQLKVVVVPAVTSAATAMDETAKAATKARWEAMSQRPSSLPQRIHDDDLPWLLTRCLPAGTLAVPVAAQSGSQDLFLRVSGGVVGFALKAVAADNGTAWRDVQDEVDKAPVGDKPSKTSVRGKRSKASTLPKGESYVLVLWSLNLAPELRAALQQQPYRTFGPGQWVLERGGQLQRRDCTGSASAIDAKKGSSSATAAEPAAAKGPAVVLTIPEGMELVITNPHADCGGGLAQLLGLAQLRQVQAAPLALADVMMLQAWMATEATSFPTAVGRA